MSKKYLLFLIGGIILVLLFIILIIFNLFSSTKTTQQTPITPSPIQTARSPLSLYITPQASELTTLEVTSITPPEDTSEDSEYGPGDLVTFTFNKDVDPSGLRVKITPERDLTVRFGDSPKEVVIVPTFGWRAGTLYTVTIEKGSYAIDGSLLQKDVRYKIRTTLEAIKDVGEEPHP